MAAHPRLSGGANNQQYIAGWHCPGAGYPPSGIVSSSPMGEACGRTVPFTPSSGPCPLGYCRCSPGRPHTVSDAGQCSVCGAWVGWELLLATVKPGDTPGARSLCPFGHLCGLTLPLGQERAGVRVPDEPGEGLLAPRTMEALAGRVETRRCSHLHLLTILGAVDAASAWWRAAVVPHLSPGLHPPFPGSCRSSPFALMLSTPLTCCLRCHSGRSVERLRGRRPGHSPQDQPRLGTQVTHNSPPAASRQW